MKISCLQEQITKSVSKITRIISNKPQLPILSYCLITAENGSISLVATNLETTIKTTIPGKIEEEGQVCLPAKITQEFLLTLSKNTVLLQTEKDTVSISCGRSNAIIPGMAAAEFPPISDSSSKTGIDLHKEQLLSSLSLVSFSAATDEARPLLMGVRFEPTQEGTSLVATDGYRLSLVTIKESDAVSSESLVIPARALNEVIRLGNEEKEQTTIRMTETIDGQLTFTLGDTQLFTRRIEGEYPNYRKIIPSTHATAVSVDTQELTRAVKSASIFARDSAGVLRISVSPGTLEVSANTPQVGENKVEIEASVEGEGGVVALNSRFLLDLLSIIKTEQIFIKMTGALSPVVFSMVGKEDFLHIIMPVRIQS